MATAKVGLMFDLLDSSHDGPLGHIGVRGSSGFGAFAAVVCAC